MFVHHIGADARACEVSGTPPTGLDGTTQTDDRYLRSVPPERSRKIGAWLVARYIEQIVRFCHPIGERPSVGLVAVADLVDETHFLGTFRHHRGVIDGLPHGF